MNNISVHKEEALKNRSSATIFGKPSSDQIWLGIEQQRALSFLSDPKPGVVKVLIGPRSSGKSSLIAYYSKGLRDTVCILSRDARNTPFQLVGTLLENADLRPEAESLEELRDRYCAYLSERYWLGKNVVVIIDEAEKLTSAVWQELYRIGTTVFDDGQTRPQIVVVGQPQAYEFLRSPMAADWNKLDYKIHRLPPLSRPDVSLYISAQLRMFGLSERVFSPEARDAIGELSGGSFGIANRLSSLSLVLARRRKATFVNEDFVRMAHNSIIDGQVISVAKHLLPNKEISDDGELLLSRDGKLLNRYKLDCSVLVGRSARNQVRLDSPEVSRHHAAIALRNDRYVIEDLGSSNGTTVNGELTLNRDLVDRDVITIGRFQLTYIAPISEIPDAARKPPRRGENDSSLTQQSIRETSQVAKST